MNSDLQRAAPQARKALAVLAAELGEPSPDMARALAIIEQMLGDIEAGRHPLDRPDDWPSVTAGRIDLIWLGGAGRSRRLPLPAVRPPIAARSMNTCESIPNRPDQML
ncbi:TPA: hypothetical protein NH715_003692 [Pseudomonas aeruginosa]|nr:hypothetical protein [Pseudomonas aeruginosa]